MKPSAWFLNLHPDTVTTLSHWDVQHLIDAMDDLGFDMLEGPTWPLSDPPSCVVIAGQHHAGRRDAVLIGTKIAVVAESINTHLPVIVTSDEASLFPWQAVTHLWPSIRWWISTPRESTHAPLADIARFFGEGPGPVPSEGWPVAAKDVDVSFAGQVTHQRRKEAVAALRSLPSTWTTEIVETPGFLQGLDRGTYLNQLARSRFVVCPSGAQTVESFRMTESLKCGAVPICEHRTPDGEDHGFWRLAFEHDPPPFPIVDSWSELEGVLDEWSPRWAAAQAECAAWAQRRDDDLRSWLRADCGLE